MKLLIEQQKSVNDGLKIVTEAKEGAAPQVYIEGIFAQSEVINGNGRKYPNKILSNAVQTYNEKYIATGKSVGEFNHPQYPEPDWGQAAIMIKELKMVGNDAYGKALVMDTDRGRHLKALISAGYNVGVSTRGLGKVSTNESTGESIVSEYIMTSVDTVDNPSAPDAHVTPIYESVNWSNENGAWVQIQEKKEPLIKATDIITALGTLYK